LDNLSGFFNCDIGLLQGEITSQLLFSIFMNDVEMYLHQDQKACITLDQIAIYLLLFADDAVIFSETAEGLQRSFDNFEKYCTKWKLNVNIEKTKVMIFKKGGRNSDFVDFTYGGQNIEIVNSFNYLGIVLSSGGSYMNATKTLARKGLRIMSSLLSITKQLEVRVRIMLALFDSFVASILNYSYEVWEYLKVTVYSRNFKIIYENYSNIQILLVCFTGKQTDSAFG
jgi:hypothetical protein